MIKDRPIKLRTNLNIVEETGECLQSYYDGELILKVKGLWFAGKAVHIRYSHKALFMEGKKA